MRRPCGILRWQAKKCSEWGSAAFRISALAVFSWSENHLKLPIEILTAWCPENRSHRPKSVYFSCLLFHNAVEWRNNEHARIRRCLRHAKHLINQTSSWKYRKFTSFRANRASTAWVCSGVSDVTFGFFFQTFLKFVSHWQKLWSCRVLIAAGAFLTDVDGLPWKS